MLEKNPSETARETLKLLATRKLLPTPDNYLALYSEIAGTPPFNQFHKAFCDVLKKQPKISPQTIREIESSLLADQWQEVIDHLQNHFTSLATLLDKENSNSKIIIENPSARQSLLADLHEQIARFVEFSLPAFGEDDPKIGPDALALAQFCRQNAKEGSIAPLKAKLSTFNHRLSFVAEDQAEIRRALLSMLRLIFENISELSLDDRWLHGQIELLMEASKPPLTLRRLDDLERRLKDVILKQSELKHRAVAAQDHMKFLLASFMEKLSEMADLTGSAHQRMEDCAKKIEAAKDITDIGPALNEALGATRALAAEAEKSRNELAEMKQKADDAQNEILKLRRELDQVSTAARHDTLTGFLNRKGLDEAIERESSRASRQQTSLCVALLDIDDFKKINDIHGHHTGDAALAHLAQVARDAMRPQDTLSRYGGEEFVILMPDTFADGAHTAMTRLQRELTRRFFMSGNNKLLITFSAGVAQLNNDETILQAIERADAGMYQAKRSGKNKVVCV